MLEPAVIVLRLAQYGGASIILGSSLFLLYALPAQGSASAAALRWPRRLLIGGAAVLALGSLLGLAAQASLLAGSVAEGLKAETLHAIVGGMDLGKAAVIRAAMGALAVVVLLAMQPGRAAWGVAAVLGALATATFPWMGHAGAAEGQGRALHITADILHAWAAAAWIGALVCFLRLLSAGRPERDARQATHRALEGFSGVGASLVLIIIATGAVNAWFLVGPDRVEALWSSLYGQLLGVKLIAVLVMLGCAAANRLLLTPSLAVALENDEIAAGAIARLRLSLLLETSVGFLVLALVAWFGTLAPPAAM